MGYNVSSDTGPFAIIPEWLFEATKDSRAIHLYGLLSRYADATGRATPSRRSIADRMGVSVPTVQRAINELVDAGALVVNGRIRDGDGAQTSNEYIVKRVSPVIPPRVTGDSGPQFTLVPPRTRAIENEREELRSSRGRNTRDLVWEAFERCFGTPATAAERGTMNAAVKQAKAALKAGGVPLEDEGRVYQEVFLRHSEAQERYDQFGPMAIVKSWVQLAEGARSRGRDRR